MKPPLKKPERIAVTWAPSLQEAKFEAMKIVKEISSAGGKTVTAEGFSLYDSRFREILQSEPYDLVITLGGDGTMLRTGKLCAPVHVPICGINMGSFGFLIEVQQNQWHEMIPLLLDGSWKIEERMMLHVELQRKFSNLLQWEVLNDAVVAHGAELRPIRVNVKVSGHLLTDYVADGLIVSTATGSTAYAMAAGGPILQPEFRNLLVIPIAPHLCLDRGLILQEGETVDISVAADHETVFSPDGAKGVILSEDDRICVSSSEYSAQFIRFRDNGFFYQNFIQYMQRNPSAVRDKS